MQRLVLFVHILLISFTASAGSFETKLQPDTAVQQLSDTAGLQPEQNRYRSLVRKAAVPAALIALSVTHMKDRGLFEGSIGLRRMVQRHYEGFSTQVDEYTIHVPVAMVVGLNVAGIEGKYHFTEQGLLLGMSHLLNRTLTNNMKGLFNIERPDGSSMDAYPSGHTSKAFAYATFFHKEYGARSIWYSVAGYSFATATGAIRILNDKHWLSDVLGGAAVGIISAEVVYAVYPYIQRKVASSYLRFNQPMAVMPFYQSGAGGIALVYRLP